MKRFFGTNAAIESARASLIKRNIFSVTAIFLLIYFLGQLLSSLILMIPAYISIILNEETAYILNDASSDFSDISEIVDKMLSNPPEWFKLASLFTAAGCGVAAIYYCTKIEHRPMFSLGFCKKGALPEYLIGFVVGLLMYSAAFGMVYLTGDVKLIGFNAEASVPMILLFLLAYIIQGASEEILCRGYYFVSASVSFNVPIAVFASSAFFALLHIGNGGISALAIINIFLFGVFAVLYFLRRGSLWGIMAIHSAWNFAQGNIWGFKVSGMPIANSVFVTEAVGERTLFNGGAFGTEGGLGVTAVLLLGIVAVAFMKNKNHAEY